MENLVIKAQTVKIDPLSEFSIQLKKGVEALNKNKEVASNSQLATATDYLNKAKTLISLVDKKVEELCRPLKDQKKEIDEAQRKIKDYAETLLTLGIKTVTKEIETAIIEFNKQQILLAKKEAERQAVANQQSQVAVGGMVIETAPIQVVEPPRVKGIMTTIWKYEVIDETIVPREYCKPDAGLLNAAVRSGIREIAGVKIYSEDSIRKS